MSVVIKKRAENALYHLTKYIEEQGYPITAVKYLDTILTFFQELDKLKLKHQICKRKPWAKFKY